MFKFLFGRTRDKLFRVLYTLKGSSFVIETVIAAPDEYEANRKFARLFPPDHVRIANATEQVK
ncbi:MAG: hypothetical protein ACO3PJ_04475 [Burkholderiaceae bacterium]